MTEPTASEALALAERILLEASADDCTIDLSRRSGMPRWTHHEYDLARALIRASARPEVVEKNRDEIIEECAKKAEQWTFHNDGKNLIRVQAAQDSAFYVRELKNAAPQGVPSLSTPAEPRPAAAASAVSPLATKKPCPYCTSDNEAIRGTYYDQTCEGCVKRMGKP